MLQPKITPIFAAKTHYNANYFYPLWVLKFYSDDHEPVHVHIVKDGHEAKYNVVPEVTQVYNHGFKKSEIKMIESVIEENVEIIIDRWNNYFEN